MKCVRFLLAKGKKQWYSYSLEFHRITVRDFFFTLHIWFFSYQINLHPLIINLPLDIFCAHLLSVPFYALPFPFFTDSDSMATFNPQSWSLSGRSFVHKQWTLRQLTINQEAFSIKGTQLKKKRLRWSFYKIKNETAKRSVRSGRSYIAERKES